MYPQRLLSETALSKVQSGFRQWLLCHHPKRLHPKAQWSGCMGWRERGPAASPEQDLHTRSIPFFCLPLPHLQQSFGGWLGSPALKWHLRETLGRQSANKDMVWASWVCSHWPRKEAVAGPLGRCQQRVGQRRDARQGTRELSTAGSRRWKPPAHPCPGRTLTPAWKKSSRKCGSVLL